MPAKEQWRRHDIARLQQLSSVLASGFPTTDIFPRDETQAGAFVAEHPQWDGRGIKIAIFDTGVDPGAAGLAVTTAGLPKIVDCVDATGSGDIDTTTLHTATNCSADVNISGLSGRLLTVPSATSNALFSNPSGRWHLGLAVAYQFFPSGLIARLRRERKAIWDAQQRQLEQRLEKAIADAKSAGMDEDTVADLQLQLQEARTMASSVSQDDRGPLFDVIAWHDGMHWKAAVDTSESGEFSQASPMSNFSRAHEYSTFGPDGDSSAAWMLNYSLNIHSDGACVEIVVNSGAHGTHVAAIAAGHFPESPELNGIAPGAQIISVKIADSRLPGSETGTGMIRGLLSAIKAGVQLINMSFGEATSLPHDARIGELLHEAIHRHGIIFVTSAMNSGPALGTVGSPAAQALGTISVGAMISPKMMQVEYSQRYSSPKPYDDERGQLATFTSRGPAPDGDLGVSICAPGAAVASVPQDTLTSFQLMNGTSMASPNACGGIALLCCAAVANGISYTSESIKALVQSTAVKITDQEEFGQGYGLLQVQAAWETLAARQHREPLVYFDVNVGGGNAKGIYLRELDEVSFPLETSVQIQPRFRMGPEGEDLDRRYKVNYQVRIALECDDEFVLVPDHMLLMSEQRAFNVLVDPTHLPTGVHYSEIRGHDTDTGEVCFRVPVTVICPAIVSAEGGAAFRKLVFRPGKIHRHFVSVPHGASQIQVTITTRSERPLEGDRSFQLHCLQRITGRSFDHTESKSVFSAGPHSKFVHTGDVEPGYTVELALAQTWTSLGSGTVIDMQVEFFGLETSASPVGAGPSAATVPRLSLSAVQPVTAVHVRATLRQTMLVPNASLTTVEQAFSAQTYSITQLHPDRDMWPAGNRLFSQLVLTYDVDVAVAGRTTMMSPLLAGVIYESQYDSQLLLVYDEHMQFVGAGYHRSRPMDLSAGKHTVYLQVRHEDAGALEALVELSPPLVVSRSLSRSIPVPVLDQFQVGASVQTTLKHGDTSTLFFNAPVLSKDDRKALKISPGDVLSGSVRYEAAVAGRVPRSYPVQYIVPATPPVAPESHKLPRLVPATPVVDGTVAQDGVLREETSTPLSALAEALQVAETNLSDATTATDLAGAAANAISAANDLLNFTVPLDLHQKILLHAYKGSAEASDATPEWQADNKRLVASRMAVTSALTLKARALMDTLCAKVDGASDAPLRLCVRPTTSVDCQTLEAELISCMRILASWNDDFCEVGQFAVRWAAWQGKLGLALRLLREATSVKGTGNLADAMQLRRAISHLVSMLGWDHWNTRLEADLTLRNPATIRPF